MSWIDSFITAQIVNLSKAAGNAIAKGVDNFVNNISDSQDGNTQKQSQPKENTTNNVSTSSKQRNNRR